MPTTITTRSGRTKVLPDNLEPSRVAGLDEDGRIVVDDFDARHDRNGHMFGLTLCCNAYDKGYDDGVYCRGCAGGAPAPDGGNNLFRAADGSFPGLDEKVSEVTS